MVPPPLLRRAAPNDATRLALVGAASFLEAFAGQLDGDDILAHCAKQHGVEEYRAYLADPATAVWLAEAETGRAPIGYLVLTAPDLPLDGLAPTDLEVKRLYLLHRFQGAGLGARLMHTARAEAAQRGARRLLLGVYAKNAAAIAFYSRLGYRQVGERDFQVGANTYYDWIMALDL